MDIEGKIKRKHQELEQKAEAIKKGLVSKAKWVVIGGIVIAALFSSPMWFSTVEKGTYEIKQTAFFGNMYAKMDPGIWPQLYGTIDVWPKAFTFFFTHDEHEGEDFDQSIEVRFVDGSICNISGTARVHMPMTEDQAIALVADENYFSPRDVEHKLILPTIRNVLRMTANMMTAQESYASKRIDFNTWARDQIENGLYQTEDEVRPVKDLVSGETIMKTFKVVKTDDSDKPLYLSNPLIGSGIELRNFEIKAFEYADKVKEQISKQQEALMAIATKKAEAQKAEQEKLTIEAQGKAAVAKAKFAEEELKVKAVVKAQKDKEVQELDAQRDKAVAVIAGQQRKEVAQLDRDAAKLKKEELILLGEGEAAKKKAIIMADGALQQKLKALERINDTWARAHSKRPVPNVMFGGGDGKGSSVDSDTAMFQQAIMLMTLDKLGLDMEIKKGSE